MTIFYFCVLEKRLEFIKLCVKSLIKLDKLFFILLTIKFILFKIIVSKVEIKNKTIA